MDQTNYDKVILDKIWNAMTRANLKPAQITNALVELDSAGIIFVDTIGPAIPGGEPSESINDEDEQSYSTQEEYYQNLEHDPVKHPSHYTSHPSHVECIEITRHMNFNLGNVIKYIWRAGLKDETVTIQDLEKAHWYLSDEINRRMMED
jgi:hypothetical protein